MKVPIFNHLERHEMEEIRKKSTHKNFQKGEIIYHEGDPLEYLYIVHKGRVKLYQLFPSGKELLIRIVEQGEFLGEYALFYEQTMDNYAEAMEETQICAIHRRDIHEALQEHPSINLKLLQAFSKRLEEMEGLVSQLSYRDVETRVAHYLIQLANAQQQMTVQLPLSKKDLASHLGTTQETISRRLAAFQTNGWIDQEGHRKIHILQLDALKEVAEKGN